MFNNLGRLNTIQLQQELTRHANERATRFEKYSQYLNAKTMAILLVDKQHENGNEIHEILESGIIKIYNENTKKLITILAIRTGQIWRYAFDKMGRKTLTSFEIETLKTQAKRNELLNLNNQ
jgi:hypothetical protein